jgi:hypothetical protein
MEVEAKVRQEAKGDTNDEDPNISDGGTLLVIYIYLLIYL